MSRPRLAEFAKCTSNETGIRKQYHLEKVTYAGKMDDEAIRGLLQYVKKRYDSVEKALDYKGMKYMAKALCRWPRPSELGRMYKIENPRSAPLKYFRAILHLKCIAPAGCKVGSLVGEMGSNLIHFTSTHRLLYAWSHDTDIYLYGLNQDDLSEAIEDVTSMAQAYGFERTGVSKRSMELSPTAKPFIPANPPVKKLNR